jgi:2-dehydro-3-deoxygalactonokinase
MNQTKALGLPPAWIAVDWGSTHLRAYAMDAGGAVLAEATSDAGAMSLAPGEFEPALLALIGPWLAGAAAPLPVLACGMVGSRQGWQEAPYRALPCAPVARESLVPVATLDARLRLWLVPGLKQLRPGPDVMRGEEVQIAGVLARWPGFSGTVCLPGTHTKWAEVSAGEVISFQTFMTGELFALLSEASVLRHALAGAGWDDAAFAAALSETLSRPEKLAAALFALRAGGLIADLPPAAARARLSGLLIGAELAAARPYWLGRPVLLIGAEALCGHYAKALAAQGLTAEILPAKACVTAGLAPLVMERV